MLGLRPQMQTFESDRLHKPMNYLKEQTMKQTKTEIISEQVQKLGIQGDQEINKKTEENTK